MSISITDTSKGTNVSKLILSKRFKIHLCLSTNCHLKWLLRECTCILCIHMYVFIFLNVQMVLITGERGGDDHEQDRQEAATLQSNNLISFISQIWSYVIISMWKYLNCACIHWFIFAIWTCSFRCINFYWITILLSLNRQTFLTALLQASLQFTAIYYNLLQYLQWNYNVLQCIAQFYCPTLILL